MYSAQFDDTQEFFTYFMGGYGTITIVNPTTSCRLTYQFKKPKWTKDGKRKPARELPTSKQDTRPIFIRVLNGPQNTSDYQFIGTFFPESMRFCHSHKSKIHANAKSVKAFAWLVRHINNEDLVKRLEIWHERKCGRCGRKLTVPASIAAGIGPECAEKMGF